MKQVVAVSTLQVVFLHWHLALVTGRTLFTSPHFIITFSLKDTQRNNTCLSIWVRLVLIEWAFKVAKFQTKFASITLFRVIDCIVAVDASLLFDDCLSYFLLVWTLPQNSIEVYVLIVEIIVEVIYSLLNADTVPKQIIKLLLYLVLSWESQIDS